MKILLANTIRMVNQSGGCEKVCCAFANEMRKVGHEVAIVYSDERDGDFFFPIDEAVWRYNLQNYDGRVNRFSSLQKVKREVMRLLGGQKAALTVVDAFNKKYLLKNAEDILRRFSPDIIICFQPASAKLFVRDISAGVPVILMCHGEAEDLFRSYPDADLPAIGESDVVQVLLPTYAESITSRFPQTKTVVIGNAVPQYEKAADLAAEKEQYKIIFVGRLAKNHKRPHLLVEAFISLADEFPDWIVEIWGAENSRGYKKEMQRQIDRAGLTNRILLKGTTQKVEQVYGDGDIFVFPTAFEGFGLTMAEAMSKGLPAIGYKSCVAVHDLIRDGVDGLWAEDGVKPLAEKMAQLMRDKERRIKLGQAAREAMKAYSAPLIWDKWNRLIAETVGEKSHDTRKERAGRS